MVSVVIVSHLQSLADAAAEAVLLMAKGLKITAVGGNDENKPGTSYDKITKAIESVYSDDGVVVIADIGSSVMMSKTAVEDMTDDNKKVKLADCPFLEGAIAAGVCASCGLPFDEVINQAEGARKVSKK